MTVPSHNEWLESAANQWLSVREFSRIYGKCERRVQQMCQRGEMFSYGFILRRSMNRNTGTGWWIRKL